jgi:NADH:ubiquinone oxidoreductase subunit F (NADH-binding)
VSAQAALLSRADTLPRLLGQVDPLTPAIRRGDPTELIEAVAASGLTGRGGAGFPTAIKLRAVAESRDRAVVVANGAEGEPPSAKDKFLLLRNPHLVIDGALAAAAAVNADDVILAVGANASPSLARLEAAVEARGRARSPRLALVRVPDRFVAG